MFTVNSADAARHGRPTWPTRRPTWACAAFYQRKRDLFRAGLAGLGLRAAALRRQLLPVRRLQRASAPLAAMGDMEISQWLTREIGVAAIPLSAFYGGGSDAKVIRFCFAKKDETLDLALERLKKIRARTISVPRARVARRPRRATDPDPPTA